MFTRKIETVLDNWLISPRRKPLILRGARQVGKTSLIEKWAKDQGRSLIKFNLETHQLLSLEQPTIQMDRVIEEIELKINRRIDFKNDILFLDEIQKKPQAIASLRYFYEVHPQLALISAGSLLDFVLSEAEISFPVGRVEFLYLGPVLFSDFLRAIGKSLLAEKLQHPSLGVSEEIHQQLKQAFRLYLFIGGMPEAIQAYIETQNLIEVRKVHHQILQTFIADFAKYSKGRNIEYCETLFKFVPGHLGQKSKYSEMNPDAKSRDLKKAIDLLLKARVLLRVRHSNATNTPLSAFDDDRVFKLFFLDVGLCSAAQGEQIENLLYGESILVGPLTEQFVAQHLSQRDPHMDVDLFYWLRDKSSRNAEVDFVIQKDNDVLPIEVKAEAGGTLRSLHAFMAEHPNVKRAIRVSSSMYLIENVNLVNQVKTERTGYFQLMNLPLWYIECVVEV